MTDQERIKQLEQELKQLREEFDEFKSSVEHGFNSGAATR
jgi:uncharacterized membrane-anchored protein YhcB (DUF1043 family)